jgi:hypothetical protein
MVTIREGLNLIRRVIEVFLAVAVMTFAAGFSAVAAQEETAPIIHTGGETSPAITAAAAPPGWLERDTLTSDWGGVRPWLKDNGITLRPRLTQFYQGWGCLDSSASRTAIPISSIGWPSGVWAAPA